MIKITWATSNLVTCALIYNHFNAHRKNKNYDPNFNNLDKQQKISCLQKPGSWQSKGHKPNTDKVGITNWKWQNLFLIIIIIIITIFITINIVMHSLSTTV